MAYFKKNWWKILAVILVIYTIVFSFTIPLSPTITNISVEALKVGENNIIVTGYNTSFTKVQNSITANVEFDNKLISCAENIKVIDDNHLSMSLMMPSEVPSFINHLRINTPHYSIFVPEIIKVFQAQKVEKEQYISCGNLAYKLEKINVTIPNRLLLNETIRNLMFHVPMWFTMMIILMISFIYSIRYLRGFNTKFDIIASEAVNIGLLFAVLGLLTGMIWTKFTWSDHTDLLSFNGWWANDVKLNGAAITTLIYIAYRILRRSIEDEQKRARISAIYNIFAFVMMIVFIMVLPRITDSLHPGNGGNPAFSQYDLDNILRMIFYPAVLGWALLGIWFLTLNVRLTVFEQKENDH